MKKPLIGKTAFIGCVLSTLWLVGACANHDQSRWAEESRVTSPDGRFDAVIVRESVGGSFGSIYWNVSILPTGQSGLRDVRNSLFYAATLKGEKLVWHRDHLLEIHYDMANIERFRNVWGSNEIEKRGWTRGDYAVEILLVPSTDYSFLTPDGGFKSEQER